MFVSVVAHIDDLVSFVRIMRVATALLALLALGCTDRSLYGKLGQEPLILDKITITGVLCTDNPATRVTPEVQRSCESTSLSARTVSAFCRANGP